MQLYQCTVGLVVNSRSEKAISALISLQRVPLSLPGLSLQENHTHFPLTRLQNVQGRTSPSQSCSLPANTSFLVCSNLAEKTSHHFTSSGSLTRLPDEQKPKVESLKCNPSVIMEWDPADFRQQKGILVFLLTNNHSSFQKAWVKTSFSM